MKTELTLLSEGKKRAICAIILTSYARDTLLDRAIRSALNQTCNDLIVLVVDDNSGKVNPKTPKVIERAALDKRVWYFRAETRDIDRRTVSTFARNINHMLSFCIKGLSVKYISYLACDDIYYNNRLQLAVNYLETHPNINSCWAYLKVMDTRKNQIGLVPTCKPPKTIFNPVAVLDHNCVTHRLDTVRIMSYPYWPIKKDKEHGAPDGEFFLKLIRCGGPIQPVANTVIYAGEKLRHGNSIQGRRYGW